MKICFATPDISGPVRNGGVGTAFLGLAELLRAHGHDVSIFYTSKYYEYGSPAYWASEFWLRHGMEFIPLEGTPPPLIGVPMLYGATDHIANSYLVYAYLKSRPDFDIIHFPDYLGIGYYTLMAKAVGLDFQRTPIIVTAHGPLAWSREHAFAPTEDLKPLICGLFERFVVEHADALISPSRFMLTWFTQNGWKLPTRTATIPNRLPAEAIRVPCRRHPGTRRISELVFFGRIEQRKGIHLFIDAINELLEREPQLLEGVAVTFLGKLSDPSVPRSMLELRLANWSLKWSCIDRYDAHEALNYLSQAGRLAVVPSLMDNAPCTIVECLHRRIPFLATNVGGIPELVREYHQLAAATAHDLATKLKQALRHGHAAYNPSGSQQQAGNDLLALHTELFASAKKRCVSQARRTLTEMVSVCLLHRDRTAELRCALKGLAQQTYANFEVIIADNGSTCAAARSYLDELERAKEYQFPVKVLRIGYNAFPGPARNAAARLAQGEILKFQDDDNVSKPNELSVMVEAIHRGFELVTCGLEFFEEITNCVPQPTGRGLIFIGDGGGLALMQNVIGDANFAIRRSAFERISGFDDIGYLYEAEDWHFLAKAQANGLKIATIPRALVWYRTAERRNNNNWRKRDFDSTRFRIARTLARGLPHSTGDLFDCLSSQGANLLPGSGVDRAADLAERRWVAAQLAATWTGQFARFFGRGGDSRTPGWDKLIALLRKSAVAVPEDFDEARYLADNADVAAAVQTGRFKSGYMHYLLHGRSERRKRPTRY